MSLRFEVQEIPSEGLRVEGSLTLQDLDLEREGITPVGPLVYELTIRVVSGEFLAAGKLVQPVRMQCSRCLKPITNRISVEKYRYVAPVKDAKIIDLTGSVREDIIFALPLKPLCREDCKGICPHCGKDLNTGRCSCPSSNVDDRWSELENIKFRPENR